MSIPLPPCPHLPEPRPKMDWRVFDAHGENRGASFYHTALEYGHYLWQHGYAARVILCLDRAMGAELRRDDPILGICPVPYAAMAFLHEKACRLDCIKRFTFLVALGLVR